MRKKKGREGGKGGKRGYCRSREERGQSSAWSWRPEVPWQDRPQTSHKETELRKREREIGGKGMLMEIKGWRQRIGKKVRGRPSGIPERWTVNERKSRLEIRGAESRESLGT